jgi:hypothetical protein
MLGATSHAAFEPRPPQFPVNEHNASSAPTRYEEAASREACR